MEKARTAEEVHVLFEKRFTAGDLEGLVSLYEKNALIAPQADQIGSGHAGIRDALAGFLALKGRFITKLDRALVAEDIGLLYSNWTLDAKQPDGSSLRLVGQTSDVVRRQPDGTWLFVIDSPFGGGWGKPREA